MDKAKAAISKLTSGHGHHTTDVTEHYQPAVTEEHVSRTREHQDTTVVDKEMHHDHHHTSVLPIKDQEVMPTEHKHVMAPAKHTEHHHGDHKHVQDKVAAEAAAFKDTREVGQVQTSHTAAPTVGSEHHHHHVHETIQPVIQKQTIQPSVVHTTVPVHEVHHTEPKHYTGSALPAVSMDEFKKQGGSLTGLADRTERFEGQPEGIANRGTHSNTSTGMGSTGTHNQSTTSHALGSTGHTGASSTNTRTDGGFGTSNTGTGIGHKGTGNDSSLGSSTAGTGLGHKGASLGDSNTTSSTGMGTTGSTGLGDRTLHDSTSQSSGKQSLLQKLNPFTDADGDGKKGFMS